MLHFRVVTEESFRQKLHSKNITYLEYGLEILVPLFADVENWLALIQEEKYLVAEIEVYLFTHQQIRGDFNGGATFIEFIGAHSNDDDLVVKVIKLTKEFISQRKSTHDFAHLSMVKSVDALVEKS